MVLNYRDQVKSIIHEDNPERLDEIASRLGAELAAKDLSNNQIRNIFGTARQIEARRQAGHLSDTEQKTHEFYATRREFILLKPKLAYQAARHNKPGLTLLKDWLTEAINATITADHNQIEEDIRFQRFMDFFEAVLAYHYEAEQAQSASNRGKGRR